MKAIELCDNGMHELLLFWVEINNYGCSVLP